MSTPRGSLMTPRASVSIPRGSLTTPRASMSTPSGSLIALDVETPKELQLRVTPMDLKFVDTQAGKMYRQTLTIQNLGPWNQKIRFLDPVKPQFNLNMTSLDKELASGLQMTAVVEYHPNVDEDTFDQLIIVVGNKAMEIPLIGLIPNCQLEIVPEVNFGILVANSKVHSKEIRIVNRGKAPGTFKTDYQGQLPITISPSSGIVSPRSSTIVQVDFCADEPRVVNEVAKVSLEGRPIKYLKIKVSVVEQILELLNMNDNKKVECIRFGSAYFGTSKFEYAILYNNSPAPINWVAIIQNDAFGESGTNIHQRTDVAINNLTYFRKIKDIDITTFISCVPNEGRLLPYEKIKITFCFSPKLIVEGKKDNDPSHRQDYAVFLRFDSVGSKDGFLRDDNSKTVKNDQFQKFELALTGSGFPVVLQFDLGNILHFPPCNIGQSSKITFYMENRSKVLPLTYQYKKTANFKVEPERGKVGEGCMQRITCSFIPHQFGVFEVKQYIEFIGPVADKTLRSLTQQAFHQIYLLFKTVCIASPKEVVMKINPGISPFITNPTGQFMVKDLVKCERCAPVAMLQSDKTTIHDHRSSKGLVSNALIAFPNDRAGSVRSTDQDKYFRTIFTKTPRHHYVDPDYAYTNYELLEKKGNENYYNDYIRNMRLEKQARRASIFYCYDFNRDDAEFAETVLYQVSGLQSPSLSLAELKDEPCSSSEHKLEPYQLLCTSDIESKEAEALAREVHEGLKPYPSTPQETRDCTLMLTPRQIHQVIIGPAVLNFGDICVNSINNRPLHVVNMLSSHVFIKFDVNLKELKKTKQLSYVIPPSSSAYIPMIFQSPNAGKFWKSFTFTVNSIPGGHILVVADVLPVRLELSSKEVVLKPHGFFLKTCFRDTVTLYNHQNYVARFEWIPAYTKKIGFFIRPNQGSVEPYSSLKCEVVWIPGFSSPERGGFVLRIDEGDSESLKCIAQPGNSKVVFLEPRIFFSNIPQGLTTSKRIVLHNVGQNHAYFKVCQKSLLPIINIIPSEGVIPLGGQFVLNICCTPTIADKFDTVAKVAVYHAETIDLRIGGISEFPDVEITPDMFNFGGTYINGTQTFPFLVKNKGIARVRVEFNLENRQYFSMDFKDKSVKHTDPEHPDVYFVELEEHTSMECGITFSPKEVASYQFHVPVRINFFDSSDIYTEYHLSKVPLPPQKIPIIRPCFVQATVLQSPVRLSNTDFMFDIPSHTVYPETKVTKTEDLVLHNFSTRIVDWTLDISKSSRLFQRGIFKFSELDGFLQPDEEYSISITFCPLLPKKYTANIPLRLNNIPVCYQMLHLVGEIKSPKLLFDRPFVLFTPAPLNLSTEMEIKILPQSYYRDTTLRVRIPSSLFLGADDSSYSLSASFPEGRTVKGSPKGINTALTCRLSFKSSKPVSFFTGIFVCDSSGNKFLLPVTATVENCILSYYPFMAVNYTEKIVIRNERDPEPVKSRYSASLPYKRVGLSSSAPSKFNEASLAKRFFIGIEETPENLDVDKNETSEKEENKSMENEKKKQLLSEQEKMTENFYQKVVRATEIWFTLFGWPEGPHYLFIPESIRSDVCKMYALASVPLNQRKSRAHDSLRYTKTIYDVIRNLSGRMPEGIAPGQSLPMNCHQRVIKLYMQYSSLLHFLSTQGAYFAHILPEFLLEPGDYKIWHELKNAVVLNAIEFETWSKRAWTDLFLQMYKVLVLSRISPHPKNKLPSVHMQKSPRVNPCLASSNIYSKSERILLSWMNTNYENTRHIIWQNCQHGTMPPGKWILNFDEDLSDGLVFAALLAAYCPFLIEAHFVNMYTEPKCFEQRFHNSLIIVNSFHDIGFSTGIEAPDICEPNPIQMLMLCVYMYERLPSYLPRKLLTFQCTLHETATKHILVKNPSSTPLGYTTRIIGRDAADFSVVSLTGSMVTIPPKEEISVAVNFTSRFLHPTEASLLLISKHRNAIGGSTMMFPLKGEVSKFNPISIINCRSPCYKWQMISVNVQNPFLSDGDFNVILVESSTMISTTSQLTTSGQFIDCRNQRDGRSNLEYDKDAFQAPRILRTSIRSSFIREYFCSTPVLHMQVRKPMYLELCFVPFDMETRYCIIILSNKNIGELVYAVEGTGVIPLPSVLPAMMSRTSHSFDCRNTPEVVHEEEPVLYLKCKPKHMLSVNLMLPLMNEAKEKALAFAAKQQMSDIEYQRRSITGTLESSSVRVAIALLGLTRVETSLLFNISKLRKPKSILYTTELSLPGFFYVPKEIHIPQYKEILTKELKPSHPEVPDDSFVVSLHFFPLTPGHYPCRILLTSKYDVRLFYLEGIVSDERPEATFEFQTPAFKALTQNIPIINKTRDEWRCHVIIEGDYFSGPSDLTLKPGETMQYPLTFEPALECEIMGKVTVQNILDGMEHIVAMKGIGRKPVALEHIIANCKVGVPECRTIIVPNNTKETVTLKVTSNLPIVWGKRTVTIEPNDTARYTLHINSGKRGAFHGRLLFSIESTNHDDSENKLDHDEDQCQDLVPILWESESEGSCTLYEEESDDQGIGSNVRVWYNLDIYIHPAEPVNIVEIKCVALEGICFDIPLRNAQEHMINMDVIISNPAFLAPREFTLAPQQCMDYHVRYTPAATGCRKESIIFQPDNFVEFWYLLKFIVDLPTPIVMPEVQCDLGKFVAQTIYLRNPTCETLELQIKNSNPDNFEVKIQTSPLIILPHGKEKVPVQFRPSGLGRAGHQGSIIFYCAQFEEWKCLLSGVGLFPQPLEVQKVTTFLHKPISIAIDFENPTKENVLVNILLTNQQVPKKIFLGIQCSSFFAETSAFRLAMTASKGIELSPRMRTRILVCYNPKIVKIKKTMVVIQMMRANGKNWPIDNFDELPPEMKKLMGVDTGEIHTIRWIYPIIGLPQAKEDQGPPVVITCQAKKLIETNMQVILSGDFIGQRPILFTKDFSVVPKRNSYSSYEDVDVLPIRREFEYEFIFESEEEKSFLKPSLDLELINTVYIFNAQLIILDFTVKFSPKKPLRSNIMLKVECILDGIWNFPVTLVATDPETEDVIHIAGSGLCKESVTELLLLGRKSKAVPFSAYFQPGSDPEFFVRPESGEIPPRDSDGIILLVGFKPQMYGKKYNSKLVVETDDMYYLYEVIGIPEVPTVPPQNIKSKISTTRKKVNKKIIIRHDFVSENINAVKSRVSSTIKSASLVSNNKK
ncbi:cilia- and flagella-associated protein 47 [Saccopteryx bilineata]|uniref:cilia- and flagella-associated protein 47 n=1 Tax=Saccopteryx bilineata TaxID=59482 RepID=UPI00338E48F6